MTTEESHFHIKFYIKNIGKCLFFFSLTRQKISILYLKISAHTENITMFSEETMSPNPPIGSGDIAQTRLIFTVFIVCWPWKLGQGHQNLINSFNYPNDTIHKVWSESIIWFKRWCADKLFFGQNVTFKMLVWSWKWGQGHQNLISFSCFSGVLVHVWSKSTNWFTR